MLEAVSLAELAMFLSQKSVTEVGGGLSAGAYLIASAMLVDCRI